MATGRCLCGAVRYQVDGPLRDVLICHCEECRRWHGHVSACTAARREDLVLIESDGLRWIDSPHSDADGVRSDEELEKWVRRGVGYARSLPPKSK